MRRARYSRNTAFRAQQREICRRAEANVAAVNYHFGSKDALLAEALNFAPLAALQKASVNAADCPEERLRLFLREFMLMLLDDKNPSSQCRIMARELADPTPALDKIVREAIAPLHKFLAELVREIVGNNLSDAELRRCVHSIVGQCLFYRHSHPVLQRLYPKLRYGRKEIEAIGEHIAEFSLAGIKHLDKSSRS